MASFKLGKEQSPLDLQLSKEKIKDGSKLVTGKAPKKQLPLPPSQSHHHHQVSASSSSPSVISVSSTSTTLVSSTTPLPSASQSIGANLTVGASSSSSSPMIFSPPSLQTPSLSPVALLRELLSNIAGQRNQIFALINSIDPSFLTNTTPKFAQEHKLLNQVVELQRRIVEVSEEVNHMRSKNAQLEQQLTSFHAGKRGAP